MEEIFINKIKINKVRNLDDFEIFLSEKEKKNLIITGKNGSGKTTLLSEIKQYLTNIPNGQFEYFENQAKALLQRENNLHLLEANSLNSPQIIDQEKKQIADFKRWFDKFGGTDIEFNNGHLLDSSYKSGNYIIAYFGAKRNIELNIPKGINAIEFRPVYSIDEFAGKDFIQFIVNLKADRSFAKDDSDIESVKKIDEWFSFFEENLFRLFNNKNIKLQFDRKTYNFNLIEKGKKPYNLNQLSDGYSAILRIVTELIMRMETQHAKVYDVQGIVLIDEIETHLHVELQKTVLPFLTSFFPKVQFIVTTHSPFVISSLKNVIICDIEKRFVIEDLSGYSYDAIIESYFDSDKYSNQLKEKLEQYELLLKKESLTDNEKESLFEIKKYFNGIPKFLSKELELKLYQLELQYKDKL